MSAAKPTWSSSHGGGGLNDGSGSAPTGQYSSRDLKSHSKLKLRQPGQDAPSEVQARNFAAELLRLENKDKGVIVEEIEAESGSEQEEVKEADTVEEDSESDDDDDDPEALLRELEAIKKEREAERLRRLQEQQEAEETALEANPLLRKRPSAVVKRRWDDDAVFRGGQAAEEQPPKRFINDVVRSDFHRKFIKKYIR